MKTFCVMHFVNKGGDLLIEEVYVVLKRPDVITKHAMKYTFNFRSGILPSQLKDENGIRKHIH